MTRQWGERRVHLGSAPQHRPSCPPSWVGRAVQPPSPSSSRPSRAASGASSARSWRSSRRSRGRCVSCQSLLQQEPALGAVGRPCLRFGGGACVVWAQWTIYGRNGGANFCCSHVLTHPAIAGSSFFLPTLSYRLHCITQQILRLALSVILVRSSATLKTDATHKPTISSECLLRGK
jgi:hypothetical protein